MPRLVLSLLITFTTVAVVLATDNLALGVGVGVLLSALCFAARIAKLLHVTSHFGRTPSEIVYHVRGQLFFASTTASDRPLRSHNT